MPTMPRAKAVLSEPFFASGFDMQLIFYLI